MKTIVLGAGCFWCTEAVFQRVKGVSSVVSGYAGGGTSGEPGYWDLHVPGNTYAEVIQVTYDPEILPLAVVLEVFFGTHNPTVLQQPGTADKGAEYRSIILCSEEELEDAEAAKKKAQEDWDDPILTEIRVLDKFTEAEIEHQNYYNRNEGSNPYCQVVINPKLDKFRKRFDTLVKEDS